MNKIKIRGKEYNCSNIVYWYIKGLESENRVFNCEIKGHEKSELELQQRIDKAIEYIEEHKEPLHHWFDEPNCDYWLATNPNDILNILRGDSDDIN